MQRGAKITTLTNFSNNHPNSITITYNYTSEYMTAGASNF